MGNYGWEIVPGRIPMPAAGGTVATQGFTVPRAGLVLAVYAPALAGGATLKLQTLVPPPDDQVPDVWQDVSTFDLAGGGTPVALAAIPGNAMTTVPITACGAGVLRFVASADQSGAPSTITIAVMCL